ncbi:MAG: prepilin-type N-terminal cleavage/methylation domain-containing protein [Kiritimatiellia bacterium]
MINRVMHLRSNRKAGFSMIEVLVAATILMVIVMMLGMLFQQTGIAWRVGLRRADAFTQVRSLVGAIQRDAAKAVDENAIDDEVRNKLGGSQQFDGSTISFYTLDSTGFELRDDGTPDLTKPRRSVSFITYNTSGNRTETYLNADGSTKDVVTQVRDFAVRVNADAPTTTLDRFKCVDGLAEASGLPLFIYSKAKVVSQGYALDVGAESAGPDGKWNTDDDIRTWAK